MKRTPPTLEALEAQLAVKPDALPGSIPDFGPDLEAEMALAHLGDLAPAMAPPDDLLARIEAEIDREEAAPIRTVRAGDGRWSEFRPGIWQKTLTKGAAGRMILLRCAPGSVIPGHTHDHDEHVLVLEGSFRMGALDVHAGDAQYSPAGSVHPDIFTAQGCLLLIHC